MLIKSSLCSAVEEELSALQIPPSKRVSCASGGCRGSGAGGRGLQQPSPSPPAARAGTGLVLWLPWGQAGEKSERLFLQVAKAGVQRAKRERGGGGASLKAWVRPC